MCTSIYNLSNIFLALKISSKIKFTNYFFLFLKIENKNIILTFILSLFKQKN